MKSTRMWMWIGRRPRIAAPSPKPVMASSEIGVSKQRSLPNFSGRPLVVPKIDDQVGTPMP
jgi:hypothetical protein